MTTLSSRDRARLLIVIAALLWSTSGFFAKAPWFDDWPIESRGLALAFWRAVFAAIFVLPFVRRPTLRLAMIPMSLSFTVMTYSFLVAMVTGSETTTIWLQYVAPVWVAIAGWFGLSDRPRRTDLVMIALAMVGIVVILGGESIVGGGDLAGGPVGLGLLSGVTFAGVLLSIRHLRGLDVAWLGLVNYGVSAVCLAPLVLGKVPMPAGGQWAALILFGSLQFALPYMLVSWAVRHVQSNEASLLTLLEPLTVPLWTFLAWRSHPGYRPPQWWIVLGGSLIACAFIWRYGRSRRLKQPESSRIETPDVS